MDVTTTHNVKMLKNKIGEWLEMIFEHVCISYFLFMTILCLRAYLKYKYYQVHHCMIISYTLDSLITILS